MASRKEEKERLRRERIAAERQAEAGARKRLILGYAVAGVLALAIVAGIVVAIAGGGGDSSSEATAADSGANVNTMYGVLPKDIRVDDREGTPPPEVSDGNLQSAAKAAGCRLDLNLKNEGATHLAPGDDLPKYETSPPTSGDHYVEPLADGVFLDTPSPGNFVHSLEHGRVEIEYDPDLAEAEQLELKGVVDADRAGMIMFPNADIPGDVSVAAWTQLMTCKDYDGAATLDAIRAFRDAYRGRGPEAIPY